jgi:hypothetical protein
MANLMLERQIATYAIIVVVLAVAVQLSAKVAWLTAIGYSIVTHAYAKQDNLTTEKPQHVLNAITLVASVL